MKHCYLLATLSLSMFLACGPSNTQRDTSTESNETEEEEYVDEDKSQRPSPPRTATGNISGVNVTIDYSSPAVKGREIFGQLEPYGKIWRTGANEATVISFDDNVFINGSLLKKGKYALFTIPGETEWVVIFNKEPNQWGAFNYNEAEDALRIPIKVTVGNEITERLRFTVSSEGRIDFAWEKVSFSLSVSNVAPNS